MVRRRYVEVWRVFFFFFLVRGMGDIGLVALSLAAGLRTLSLKAVREVAGLDILYWTGFRPNM